METAAKAPLEPEKQGRVWAPVVAPLVFGLVAYARTLSFGLSYLDDNVLDDQKPFLSHFANALTGFGHLDLLKAYYRPLVTASYVVDAQWSGSGALAYHATNLVVHLLAVGLVYVLLTRLRVSTWAAALGASLFAVHPALVEAVAWIPGRNDLLFTVFALGAWVLLVMDAEKPSPWLRSAHAFCLVAALFGKETAVVLPLLFLVAVWSLDGSSAGPGRSLVPLKRLWPIWVGSLGAYALVRFVVVSSERVTAPPSFSQLTGQLPVLLTSLGKLWIPWGLSPLATFRDSALWSGLAAAGIVAVIGSLTRWPRPRRVVLAGVTFLLPLLPTLFVADRLILENRLYLPAVGLCLFVAEALDCWRPRWPRAMAVAAALVVAGALGETWMYAGSYRDRDALSAAAVESSPSSALGHLQRGDFYYRTRHDLEGAEAEYRRAIDLDPREPVVHNNLGVLLLAKGQFAEADSRFEEELAIRQDYAPAHYNRGLALRSLNRADEAAQEWEAALRDDPTHIGALGELMVYHFGRGDSAKGTYYREQLQAAGVRFTSPSPAN